MESRPLYKVGAAGLDPRDGRLIEIVFKHSQYNRYEFALLPEPDPATIDILIVNTGDPAGVRAVSSIRNSGRHVPVVAAVPRGAPSSARHAISIDRLTLQLLPILNRVVDLELNVAEPREGDARFGPGLQNPPNAWVAGTPPGLMKADRSVDDRGEGGADPSSVPSSAPAATEFLGGVPARSSAFGGVTSPGSSPAPSAAAGPASPGVPAVGPVPPAGAAWVASPRLDATSQTVPTPAMRPGVSSVSTPVPPTPVTSMSMAPRPMAPRPMAPIPEASAGQPAAPTPSGASPHSSVSAGPMQEAPVQAVPVQAAPAMGAPRAPWEPAEPLFPNTRPVPAAGPSGLPVAGGEPGRAESGTLRRPAAPANADFRATSGGLTAPSDAPAATEAATGARDMAPRIDEPRNPVPKVEMLRAEAPSREASRGAASYTDPARLESRSNLVAFPMGGPVPGPAATEAAPRLRALIVDDSPTVRQQLTAAFERMGMDVVSADSASAALEHLRGGHFDLALVDVVMPDMDGYKLTREIKRNKQLRQMPVIILTSKTSPFDLARGALAGCDSYLSKPVPLRALEAAVLKQLRKSLAIDDLSTLIRTGSQAQSASQTAQAREGDRGGGDDRNGASPPRSRSRW